MQTRSIDHPLRSRILGEIHARPYRAVPVPSYVIRQSFLREASNNFEKDYLSLLSFCRKFGLKFPDTDVRHYTVSIEGIVLTWERHSEFLSLTWLAPAKDWDYNVFQQKLLNYINELIQKPHLLICATKIDLMDISKKKLNVSSFAQESLCISELENGSARLVTDFRTDTHGAIRFLVGIQALSPVDTGILVTRILEIETYRAMALLGFEKAKDLTPHIDEIENQVVKLTTEINARDELDDTRQTLENITKTSASLASIAAANQYRLSATQAYYKLVQGRLKRLEEVPVDGSVVLEEFLARRLAPAMRTCETIKSRIEKAGSNLRDATHLLRTKIDLQVQDQNQAALDSMNQRSLMQYRLQSTVEGLSIAAVSYYVVGLFNYGLKGLMPDNESGLKMFTAISVPFILILIWVLIRRIRKSHETT